MFGKYIYAIFLVFVVFFGCKSQNHSNKTEATNETVKKTEKEVVKKVETIDSRKSLESRMRGKLDTSYPFNIVLKDANGNTTNTSEILKPNGKPTAVFFWLTTCTPCLYELKAVSEKYPQWAKEADFNLYAISTDFPKRYDVFCSMVKKKNWQFPAYNDTERKFRYVMPGKLNGLPQSFVFDKDGNIVYHKKRWHPGDEDKLFEKIKELTSR